MARTQAASLRSPIGRGPRASKNADYAAFLPLFRRPDGRGRRLSPAPASSCTAAGPSRSVKALMPHDGQFWGGVRVLVDEAVAATAGIGVRH